MDLVGLSKGRFRGRYDGNPTYDLGSSWFTIEYHYGGRAKKLGTSISYEDGSLSYRDWCHRDNITMVSIDGDAKTLGCVGLFDYYWCRDVITVEEDARSLKSDLDVVHMANDAIENGGYVHIYFVEKSAVDVESDRNIEVRVGDVQEETGTNMAEGESNVNWDAIVDEALRLGINVGTERQHVNFEWKTLIEDSAMTQSKGELLDNLIDVEVSEAPQLGHEDADAEHDDSDSNSEESMFKDSDNDLEDDVVLNDSNEVQVTLPPSPRTRAGPIGERGSGIRDKRGRGSCSRGRGRGRTTVRGRGLRLLSLLYMFSPI